MRTNVWVLISLALTLTLPERESITIHVLDLAGRPVALLLDAELGPGAHQTRWNGDDARGRKASPGVYWVVVTTPKDIAVRRIVRLR